MSSHHIVRDEQEPALIVFDFSPDQREDIGQLLEWSPVVIATEYSLNDLITFGVKIDMAIVKEEKLLNWEEELKYQQPINFLTAGENAIDTLSKAIRQLIEKSHHTFHIMSNQLTFFDFINLYREFSKVAELIYINESRKVSISPIGNYIKWLQKGEEIGVFAVEEATYIKTKGFVRDIQNEVLSSELLLLVKEEGTIHIETNLKPLIISEPL